MLPLLRARFFSESQTTSQELAIHDKDLKLTSDRGIVSRLALSLSPPHRHQSKLTLYRDYTGVVSSAGVDESSFVTSYYM